MQYAIYVICKQNTNTNYYLDQLFHNLLSISYLFKIGIADYHTSDICGKMLNEIVFQFSTGIFFDFNYMCVYITYHKNKFFQILFLFSVIFLG